MTTNNILGITPSQMVQKLDRFIIGQHDAKKSVAIAVRNRNRRKQIEDSVLREEVGPKNILMVGPTGVGKSEIARRLAKLVSAPFIKVEATKFTEVGYVGRDVESIIRDLVDISIAMLKVQAKKKLGSLAYEKAMERVLDAGVGKTASQDTRDKFRERILSGNCDNLEIEIQVLDSASLNTPTIDIPGMPGAAMGVLNIGDVLNKALGGSRTKTKKLTIKEAIEKVTIEESDKLIDDEKIILNALKLVENEGIVFLDEIDKVTSRNNTRGGEVSREGVQRDLLPLIEGTIVNTKYGPVNTHHILFIASGAFHLSKPSDLLPELQGRLPIRVELQPLSQADLISILKEPETSLLKQYVALIATEGVKLKFTDSGIKKIANYASTFNAEVENIGARRLHTILEKVLEDVSFSAGEMSEKEVIINEKYVEKRLSSMSKKDNDLSRFIL